jgi:hypothetical protein
MLLFDKGLGDLSTSQYFAEVRPACFFIRMKVRIQKEAMKVKGEDV